MAFVAVVAIAPEQLSSVPFAIIGVLQLAPSTKLEFEMVTFSVPLWLS